MSDDLKYELLDVDKKNILNTEWKNPPRIKDLKADYNSAKPSHDEHVKRVNRSLNIIIAEPKFNKKYGRSTIQPKTARKHNEWRGPSLEETFMSGEDLFRSRPRTYADKDAAKQNMQILNKQFNVDIDRNDFVTRSVRDGMQTGSTLIKVGWETKYDTYREEVDVDVYAETDEERLMAVAMQVDQGLITGEQADAILESGEPILIGTQKEEQIVENGKKINRPSLLVVDTRDVIVDPTCNGVFENARFLIHEFYSDLTALKSDGRYKNIELLEQNSDKYNSETISSDNGAINPFQFEDKARRKLVVREYWGFWDIHGDNKAVPVVITYVGDVIIQMEENPYPFDNFPFVLIQYIPPVTKTIYGDSDALLIEDNQLIIGAVTRGMIDLLALSANSQRGVAKGFLDPLNKTKFDSGDSFEFNGEFAQQYMMITYPQLPAGGIDMLTMQNKDAESNTGVIPFQNGISGDALGSSVGGIKTALDATAKREASILRRFSSGYIKVARMIAALNTIYLEDEEIIRITDEDFVTIKRDDLHGDYDLIITVSTAEENEMKANRLEFMMQTANAVLPPDFSIMILSEIAELRKMPALAKRIAEYTPPPPSEYELQIQQLEILKLQAEIEAIKAGAYKDQTAGDENVAGVTKINAQAGTEFAKGKKIASEADLNDLKYLNDALGRTNQHDLDKIALGKSLDIDGKIVDNTFKAQENKNKPQPTTNQR